MRFRARDRARGWYESAHQGGQHRQVMGGQREGLANFRGKVGRSREVGRDGRRGLQGLERGPIRWTEGLESGGPGAAAPRSSLELWWKARGGRT